MRDGRILSIDDLADATNNEILAARKTLRIKERIEEQVRLMGSRVGMTLAEYEETLARREEKDCQKCNGAGSVPVIVPRRVGVVHPSSAHECVLRLYHDCVGDIAPKEQIDWPLFLTFEIGHAIHGVFQRALKNDLGDAFVAEAPVNIAEFIAGNADGDVYLPKAHAVIEIKTAGNSTFDSLRAPKKEHLLQAVGMYATALDAPFVVFLYFHKTWPHPVKEFVVEYDPSIFNNWMDLKGNKVRRALDRGQPPIADASPSECAKCPYKHACDQRIEKRSGTFRRTNR